MARTRGRPLGAENHPDPTTIKKPGLQPHSCEELDSANHLNEFGLGPEPQMRSHPLQTPRFQPGGTLSREASYAVPKLLTYRNCEIRNGCCFKPLALW